MDEQRIGAVPLDEGACLFRVWAPDHERIELRLDGRPEALTMDREPRGYHSIVVPGIAPGARYRYGLPSGEARPDPASRSQPEGVHGASAVVDLSYTWTDSGWKGISAADHVVYELHVGTFTPAGTFDAVIDRLDALAALGITTIEIMPVAQFPGARNWGYDGVYPFAVQDSYGGPPGLQRLVDACHARGLAVLLDVVYNHLGPEGNYLGDYGPYFTDVYQTPWGRALNFDDAFSDGVRDYFVANALQWIVDFHMDGLRLDAVHAILDRSAYPFLEELADRFAETEAKLGRRLTLVAESDSNDPRIVLDKERGGLGLDSMWCDDFHHSVHALLTGERNGYYADFGSTAHLASAWETGLSYQGGHSEFRKRRHGRPIDAFSPRHVVACVQNHDQVGNRMLGERLSALVDFEKEKLAAALLLLSPHVPLLFMGQEYGETAPFQYFVSHGDPELVRAVQQGRRDEFRSFGWKGEVPDPQSEATFERCVLDWAAGDTGRHAILRDWYRELLGLRRRIRVRERDTARAFEEQRVLTVARDGRAFMAFSFSDRTASVLVELPPGTWKKAFDSADPRWDGSGAAASATSAGGSTTLTLPRFSCAVYLPDGTSD